MEKDEMLNEQTKKDLLEIVDHRHWEYSIPEMVEWMVEKGYDEGLGDMILESLKQNLFSISSIDDDGQVWLELGSEGDEEWEKDFKGREGFSED
jgi:hypothetical protein